MTVNIDSLLVNGTFNGTQICVREGVVLTVVNTLLWVDAFDMGIDAEGNFIPAWPIGDPMVNQMPDISWAYYLADLGDLVGELNGNPVMLSYVEGRYVLSGRGFLTDLAVYSPIYGWVPSSPTPSGLHISVDDAAYGFARPWPMMCPVPDGVDLRCNPDAIGDEPVWFIDGIYYQLDGSPYIEDVDPLDDHVYSYSTNVPEMLQSPIPAALCLGIEVEFSTYDVCTVVEAIGSTNNKALFKKDSSCGIELVSVPLLPSQMIKFLSNLKIDQLGVDRKCGVHLHVSRRYLTQSQLGGLVVFMNHPDNLPYIQEVAGRNPNKYCKQVPGKVDTTSMDRYEMVNLTNSATVEIRIFAGTNDKVVLRGYVEWLLSLIEWLDTCPTNYSHQSFKKYLVSHS